MVIVARRLDFMLSAGDEQGAAISSAFFSEYDVTAERRVS